MAQKFIYIFFRASLVWQEVTCIIVLNLTCVSSIHNGREFHEFTYEWNIIVVLEGSLSYVLSCRTKSYNDFVRSIYSVGINFDRAVYKGELKSLVFCSHPFQSNGLRIFFEWHYAIKFDYYFLYDSEEYDFEFLLWKFSFLISYDWNCDFWLS